MPTCEACDAVLEPYEGRWDAEKGEHEAFCKRCIGAAFDAEITEEIDGLYDTPYNFYE